MTILKVNITKEMRAAAKQMIRSYYLQNYEQSKLPTGKESIYYDARQVFIQAAFDANQNLSAFSSEASGRPGYSLDQRRLDGKEKEEIQHAFDTTLQNLVSDIIEKLKTRRELPSDFSLKRAGTYFGNGYPPQGPPDELGSSTKWQDTITRPSSRIEIS